MSKLAIGFMSVIVCLFLALFWFHAHTIKGFAKTSADIPPDESVAFVKRIVPPNATDVRYKIRTYSQSYFISFHLDPNEFLNWGHSIESSGVSIKTSSGMVVQTATLNRYNNVTDFNAFLHHEEKFYKSIRSPGYILLPIRTPTFKNISIGYIEKRERVFVEVNR